MTMDERAEKAVDLKLHHGCNCAQAVTAVLADQTDLTAEQLAKLSSGFGVGMGCMEATCGALVGAGMIAGMKTGGAGTMRLTRQMVKRFRDRCGATVCRQLKQGADGKPLCSCEDCVRSAVLIYGEIMGV